MEPERLRTTVAICPYDIGKSGFVAAFWFSFNIPYPLLMCPSDMQSCLATSAKAGQSLGRSNQAGML